MPLQKKHKVMIGGVSSIVLIFMITSSIFLYLLFVKQSFDTNELKSDIAGIESKIGDLTDSLMETQSTLEESKEELSLLQASVGEDFSGIIEDSIKSVVTIRTDVAQGTGFLITDDGYIITNAHVLVGGRQVNSITSEQEIITTEFIGYDGKFDIALLKVDGNYDFLKLTDSNNVQIGEKVIAIGNPLGLQFSVSQGIVSALEREGSNGVEAYIQTDAALNPGNSGGPLINQKGKVVGINNFKVSGGENLGFALESNYIKEIVNEISQENLNVTLI